VAALTKLLAAVLCGDTRTAVTVTREAPTDGTEPPEFPPPLCFAAKRGLE
jgi:hypothetical protein